MAKSLHVKPDTKADVFLNAFNSFCWVLAGMFFAVTLVMCLAAPMGHASDDGTYEDGFKVGFLKGQNDCGGITCDELTMAIGAAKKAPHTPKTVSTFMAELEK